MADRIVSPNSGDDDYQETSLRPHRLDHYIGQDMVKGNLRILIEAALKRREALDHVLLYRPVSVRPRSPSSLPPRWGPTYV